MEVPLSLLKLRQISIGILLSLPVLYWTYLKLVGFALAIHFIVEKTLSTMIIKPWHFIVVNFRVNWLIIVVAVTAYIIILVILSFPDVLRVGFSEAKNSYMRIRRKITDPTGKVLALFLEFTLHTYYTLTEGSVNINGRRLISNLRAHIKGRKAH